MISIKGAIKAVYSNSLCYYYWENDSFECRVSVDRTVFQRNISSGGNRGEMHVTKPAKDKGRVWQSFNVILFRSRSAGRNKEVIDC